MLDLNTAQAIVGGSLALGLVSFIIRWAWTHTHKRIDEVREVTDLIFRQMREHEHEDRRLHDEFLKLTTRIDTQLGRLLSDQESEKDTRRRVNKEHSETLGSINARIEQINRSVAQITERVAQLNERRTEPRSDNR